MLEYAHPLISGLLPAHNETPIGSAFIRARPVSSFHRDRPTLKKSGRPAFDMKYVDYSIFYPCSPGALSKGNTKWFPPHQKAMVDGFKKYLTHSAPRLRSLSWIDLDLVVSLLGRMLGRVRFPAHPLAPLADLSSGQDGYPIVIFSHGLCGSRHTYSQFCSALAASGHIVLAIEHRDGSGPAVMIPTDEGEETYLCLALSELEWGENIQGSLKAVGGIWNELRTREVYEAYHHFCHLIKHGVDDRTVQIGDSPSTPKAQVDTLVESLKGRVAMEDLYLSGHSLGGGTILHTLQTPPPTFDQLNRLPVKRCILLDPWIELVSDPSLAAKEKAPDVPTLCINSPGFTAWEPNFGRLHTMLSACEGTLMTLAGMHHMSFSDFALFKLPSTGTVRSLQSKVNMLVHAFIDDGLETVPLVQTAWNAQGYAETGSVDKSKSGRLFIHLMRDASQLSLGEGCRSNK